MLWLLENKLALPWMVWMLSGCSKISLIRPLPASKWQHLHIHFHLKEGSGVKTYCSISIGERHGIHTGNENVRVCLMSSPCWVTGLMTGLLRVNKIKAKLVKKNVQVKAKSKKFDTKRAPFCQLLKVDVSLTCSRCIFLDVSSCHLVPKFSVVPPQPLSGESWI